MDLKREVSFGSFRRKSGDAPADGAQEPAAATGAYVAAVEPAAAAASGARAGKGAGKRAARGKAAYPTKTTINLVRQEAARSSILVQVALFLIVLALVGVFAKFAVVDPLLAGMDSSAEVAAAQSRLNELVAANESYAALNEKYTRYVVPGLTEEELNLADRTALLDLIQVNLMTVGHLSSVKVVGNTVTATSLGADLAQVSSLVERLETDSRVSHVTVSTAQGKDDAGTSATIEVTLKGALDQAAEAAEAAEGAPSAGAGTGAVASDGAAGAPATGKEAGNGAA